MANRTAERTIEAIAALRRLRFTEPELAEVLGRPCRHGRPRFSASVSTASGILAWIGMGKLGRLGLEPAERYERRVAAELIDIAERDIYRRRVYGARITRVRAVPRVHARDCARPERSSSTAPALR